MTYLELLARLCSERFADEETERILAVLNPDGIGDNETGHFLCQRRQFEALDHVHSDLRPSRPREAGQPANLLSGVSASRQSIGMAMTHFGVVLVVDGGTSLGVEEGIQPEAQSTGLVLQQDLQQALSHPMAIATFRSSTCVQVSISFR